MQIHFSLLTLFISSLSIISFLVIFALSYLWGLKSRIIECNFVLFLFLNTNQVIGFHILPKYLSTYLYIVFFSFLKDLSGVSLFLFHQFASFPIGSFPAFPIAINLNYTFDHIIISSCVIVFQSHTTNPNPVSQFQNVKFL